MRPMRNRLAMLALLAGVLVAPGVWAEGAFTITLENHRFSPETLDVPSGEKIELRIVNKDKTPEEFESTSLRREKIVTGGGEISVFVGPLRPGTYEYFGEYNPETARGRLVVK